MKTSAKSFGLAVGSLATTDVNMQVR